MLVHDVYIARIIRLSQAWINFPCTLAQLLQEAAEGTLEKTEIASGPKSNNNDNHETINQRSPEPIEVEENNTQPAEFEEALIKIGNVEESSDDEEEDDSGIHEGTDPNPLDLEKQTKTKEQSPETQTSSSSKVILIIYNVNPQ